MLRGASRIFARHHQAIHVAGRAYSHETIDLVSLRESAMKTIEKLPEYQQNEIFLEQLRSHDLPTGNDLRSVSDSSISMEEYRTILKAGLATQALHLESVIASRLAVGFYTIGPCGEELLGATGTQFRPNDAVALHYRHLATSIVRQLQEGTAMDDIILARARGYAVSVHDPVTGGRHCAIGGGKNDFLVTSTLASQAPPAVGRGLGGSLANMLKVPSPFEKKFVSYVSVGDGSVNNAHFLSALNLAEYASHRNFYCPTVFGISDNNISISLSGYGWLKKFEKKLRMPVYRCDGQDLLDVYETSKEAIDRARETKSPTTIIYGNLPRRFGHALTDRQVAYYSLEQIEQAANCNPLATACGHAVEEGVVTYGELHDWYQEVLATTQSAFQKAVNEPKIDSREDLVSTNSQPMAAVPAGSQWSPPQDADQAPDESTSRTRMVMRKHMTQVIDECLEENPHMIYLGEDVQHGGYYLVTEDLHKKYSSRIRDFPPDETTLLGAGMGFAQAGLLPIVEIPYAKYLDCGADMFYEAAITNWLSKGQAPIGMVIRLQGFDKGVFGGNFHTHNVIPTPCGLDVVCYSNGEDYARGFRHAVHQAKHGRLVMSVDSTNLLYLRDGLKGDDKWRRDYPAPGEMLTFDQVIHYGTGKQLAIVAYGNAVRTALEAKDELEKSGAFPGGITVIDSPYLSDTPKELEDSVGSFENVIFADVCKERQGPLAQIAVKLHNQKRLSRWSYVAAAPTYNPLGTTVTFLNANDIVQSALHL